MTNALDLEFVRARAPIPAVGVIGRGYVAPNISITGEFTFFKLPEIDEDNSGRYFDFDLYGTVNFTDNVGAQAGYRSFDVVYKVEDDDGDLQLKGCTSAGWSASSRRPSTRRSTPYPQEPLVAAAGRRFRRAEAGGRRRRHQRRGSTGSERHLHRRSSPGASVKTSCHWPDSSVTRFSTGALRRCSVDRRPWRGRAARRTPTAGSPPTQNPSGSAKAAIVEKEHRRTVVPHRAPGDGSSDARAPARCRSGSTMTRRTARRTSSSPRTMSARTSTGNSISIGGAGQVERLAPQRKLILPDADHQHAA